MSVGSLKKILCDYEFIFLGRTYSQFGYYLGDTANVRAVKRKDYAPEIICQALKISFEELALLINCKYWDMTRERLEAAGFVFKKLDIYFYPPEKKK